jgi:hypothetical protein
MLPYEDFERWVMLYNLSEQQTSDVLFPLVSNLWMLARQLERIAKSMGEEPKIEDFSITATVE